MKAKKKKCKGLGVVIGNGCEKETFKRVLGLCTSCYSNWLLNTPEGKERLEKHTLKAKEPRLKIEKGIKDKKELQKLQYLKVNVQTWCHKYIRERDKGKPCVSCGQPWNNEHQAGHFKKASDYSTLKYNEFNIHNQCKGCNLMKDGNTQRYEDRILKRITPEQKAELDRKAKEEKQISFKWCRIELEELREYYKNKYNSIKK